MSNEINLLRGSKSHKNTLLNKLSVIRMFSLSFLFLVSFSSIVLFISIALSPLPSLQKRETDEAKSLSLFNEKIVKILLTKERVANITKILKNRPVYTETLRHITAQVPSDLAIDSVKIVGSKIEMNISSSSLGNLDTVTENIKEMNLKEKRFRKIILTGLTLDSNSSRYVVSFELDAI
jgi:hypothetical protein